MFSPIFFGHVRNINDIVVHGDLRLLNKKWDRVKGVWRRNNMSARSYKKAPVP